MRAQQRPQGNHECGTSHVVKYHEHAPETPRARPVRLRSRALFGSFGKSLWGSFVNAGKVSQHSVCMGLIPRVLCCCLRVACFIMKCLFSRLCCHV